MTSRQANRLVRAAAILALSAIGIAMVIDAANGWVSGGVNAINGAVAAVFVLVGWLVFERAAGNVVGALLLAFGLLFAAYLPVDTFIRLAPSAPQAVFGALFTAMLDAPMFILIALILVLFPDGQLPSARWRPVVPLAVTGIGLVIIGTLFDAKPIRVYPAYTSPIGLQGVPADVLVLAAYSVMVVLLALGAIAVLVRWRRGNPVERAQIKWVVAAAVVLVATEVVNIATFNPADVNTPVVILTTIAIALVPIAIGIAVLRYRLYEIDRIISRSIAYAIVTGILGVTFAITILALQAVLASFIQGPTLAVAVSTLIAAALFQPLRARVQRVVDRRFDRARVDGERTSASFSERLRGQVAIESIVDDLQATIGASIRPTAQALWLRNAHGNSPSAGS